MSSDRPQLRWNDSSHRQSTGGSSSLEGFRRQDQQSIDAHQYARQQQIAGYIKQQQIAAWSRWLNDSRAQGHCYGWLRGELGRRSFENVAGAYDFASEYGHLKACSQERIQHAERMIVFEGSRDIPQHMRSFDGADLIDPDELGVAINGVERFKRVVGSASEDIEQFFLSGDTGPRLQAMFLGLKPVTFDLTWDIDEDALAISRIDDDDNDAYRKHLAEVVEPTYQKIKDHIMQTDTSRDIRFIDLITRDYSDTNNSYTHNEDDGSVNFVEGDHAIYSYSSVKRLFNMHQDVFPLDDSDNSIRSVVSEKMSTQSDNIAMSFGLLCGYPRYAVENYTQRHQGPRSFIRLLGRECQYSNTSQDPRNDIAMRKDQALYHLSGMKDFINISTSPTASSQPAPGTSQQHRLG